MLRLGDRLTVELEKQIGMTGFQQSRPGLPNFKLTASVTTMQISPGNDFGNFKPVQIGGTAFGEMLPNHANAVSLDEAKKDKWGLPVLKIDCATGENERNMRRDMINDMAEMLQSAGVKDIQTFDNGYYPGMGIHEMGTARMGRDPKTSVVNGNNQVWDAPNVFVTDVACMTSAACVNPSLTYMALTARAADFAVNALKRRDL